MVALIDFGGGGGIRTPEGFYTLPVFKTGAINRSTTPPGTVCLRTERKYIIFYFLSDH